MWFTAEGCSLQALYVTKVLFYYRKHYFQLTPDRRCCHCVQKSNLGAEMDHFHFPL